MAKGVLVIDGDAEVLESVSHLLEEEGHQVWRAKDEASAVEMLVEKSPSLVVMDQASALGNGKRVMKRIRDSGRLQRTHVLLLSGAFRQVSINAKPSKRNGRLRGKKKESPWSLPIGLEAVNSGASPFRRPEAENAVIHKGRGLPHGEWCDLLLEEMAEGVLHIDEKGHVLYANTKALALIGTSDKNLSRMVLKDLFDDPDGVKVESFLKFVFWGKSETTENLPVRVRGKTLILKVVPLKGLKSALVMLKDETDRKWLEVQLLQAQKMEAIGTMASGIAHDFNNLLMGIQGQVSIMLLDMDVSHPYLKRLRTIEKQVQSGAQLTRQLLDFSRGYQGKEGILDLNELIEEMVGTFGRTRKEYPILLDLARNLYVVEADRGQIEQVLLNLYMNAVEAMPGGGEITLRTRKATRKEIRGLPFDSKPGEYVLLCAADKGPGMEKTTLCRIFEPFFTTKETHGGHGLGLASVYWIVKSHGGHIEVVSEVGVGTEFRVYLPALKGALPLDQGKASGIGEEGIIYGKETVLSVDDEETVREAGQEMLEVMGYNVITAKDGEDAIHLFSENKEKIDIVLLDMVMPKMSGFEVLERLKRINPNVRVLLSSGYSMEGKTREILKRGCDGFIQKPYKMVDLSRTMRAILDRN